MTSISILPPQNGVAIGAPQVAGLTDDEQSIVNGLSNRLSIQNNDASLRYAYYDGQQRMRLLGVSVPPQLAAVRTTVDWPRICVDPLVQRAVLDGFRLAKATEVDEELALHWHENAMDSEAPLSFLDSLVTGRGYMIVGSPDEPGDSPVITVESPANLAMSWDPRTRRTEFAYQAYQVEGVYRAVLYLPDETISMSRESNSGAMWTVDYRDQHQFGEVPVIRFTNRARSGDREGRSEITAPIMNTTDSACRSLLGMEIAREFYSIPHRYVLGASESDFVDAAGNTKTALDMAMNKFLAMERDEQGQLPQVGQFQAFDPSVFTKIIEEHAKLMSSYTGYPPQYFGLTTTANPASADAIRVGENGLVRRAKQVQGQFSGPLRQVMKLVWRFAHNGDAAPEEVRKLQVDWVDASTATPAGTTDAIAKQVAAGIIPAHSDVTLSKLGYSALERYRLAEDAKVDAGSEILAQLSKSVIAKDAKTGLSVARELGVKTNTPPTPTPAPPTTSAP